MEWAQELNKHIKSIKFKNKDKLLQALSSFVKASERLPFKEIGGCIEVELTPVIKKKKPENLISYFS